MTVSKWQELQSGRGSQIAPGTVLKEDRRVQNGAPSLPGTRAPTPSQPDVPP